MERSNNSSLLLLLVLLLPGLSSAWVHVCIINGTHVKGYANTNTTTTNNNNNTTTTNNNNNTTTTTPINKNYTNDDNTNNNNTTINNNNNNNYTYDDNNTTTTTIPTVTNNTNLTLHAGVPFLVHLLDESEPGYFYVISEECDTYIRVVVKRTSRPVTDDSMSDELGRLWARVRYMTDADGLFHVYFYGGLESDLTGHIRGQSCIPTHYEFRFTNLDVGLECAQEVHTEEPHPYPHPPRRHSTPIIIWVPLGIISLVASLLCKGFCKDQLLMMKGSRESNVNTTVQSMPFPEQSPSPPPTPPAEFTSNPPSHLQPSTSSPTQVIRSPFDRMKDQFGFSRLHEDQ